MDSAEVGQEFDRLRRLDGEPARVEVKKAVDGLPKALVETASAFSNTNGGLIILGVDESAGFIPVRLPAPAKLRDDLVSAVSDQLELPIRLGVERVGVDGTVLVVAKIDPLPSDQRPCYVKSRGIANGSFVRIGDSDRRMTQAEIGLAIANRGQPRYDVEPVPEAGLEDLDSAVRRTGRATAAHLVAVAGRSRAAVLKTLRGLIAEGAVEAEGDPQSPQRAYRWVGTD